MRSRHLEKLVSRCIAVFNAATQQMIDQFDTALTKFEADVREGKTNVKIVSN